MIELVFIACLVSAPDRCEERGLQFVNLPSPRACILGAQPQLAKWSESHPRWQITRWTCRPMGSAGQKA